MKKQICAMTLLLSLCLLATGCGNIAEIKKWDLTIATTIGEVEKLAQTAATENVIDATLLKQIFTVTHRVSLGQAQFNAVLAAFEKTYPDKKEISISSAKEMLALLDPMSAALDPNQIAFIAGIKNVDKRDQLIAKFNVARAAVSSLQVILAASAKGA
jgi:hypothetical protein